MISYYLSREDFQNARVGCLYVTRHCFRTCGNGGIMRGWRTCTHPTPANGGKKCLKEDKSRSGYESTVRPCNRKRCPVHGKWSRWEPYTSCTVKCGGGVQRRNRFCNQPLPKYGGSSCLLSDGKSLIAHFGQKEGNKGEREDNGRKGR